MIRIPKKYNHAYVQVDNLGEPLYGLTEVGNKITKIYPCKKDIKYIVLPEYGELDLKRNDISESYMNNDELKYVKGQLVLADGCFEGLKDIKIILPARTSVKIEQFAFDADANVEFILPEDYELKTISEIYYKNIGNLSFPKHYTLIADKAVRVSTFGQPMCQSEKFTPDYLRGNVQVNNEIFVRKGEFVSKKYDSSDIIIE